MRIVLAMLLLAACGKSEPVSTEGAAKVAAPSAAATRKNPTKAREMIAAGAVVIDVRTAEEFADGHLAQATNIPVQEFATRLGEVEMLTGSDKAKPVVLYCASGNRSGKALGQLAAAGYTNLVNGGGYDDLQ